MFTKIISWAAGFFAKKLFTKDFLLSALSGAWKGIVWIWKFLWTKFSIPGIVLLAAAWFYYGTWSSYRTSQKLVSKLDKEKIVLNLKIETLQKDTFDYRQTIVITKSQIEDLQRLVQQFNDSTKVLNKKLKDCQETLNHGLEYGIIKVEQKDGLFKRLFKKK